MIWTFGIIVIVESIWMAFFVFSLLGFIFSVFIFFHFLISCLQLNTYKIERIWLNWIIITYHELDTSLSMYFKIVLQLSKLRNGKPFFGKGQSLILTVHDGLFNSCNHFTVTDRCEYETYSCIYVPRSFPNALCLSRLYAKCLYVFLITPMPSTCQPTSSSLALTTLITFRSGYKL